MIADAQALTGNAEHPEKIQNNLFEVALDYLACVRRAMRINYFE